MVGTRESPSYLIRQDAGHRPRVAPDKTTHIAALQLFQGPYGIRTRAAAVSDIGHGPKGRESCAQTTAEPTLGVELTTSPALRATFGQFQASIAPGTNQSTRWPFTSNAQATYDMQLQAFVSQRSTASAIPAAGHRPDSGYPMTTKARGLLAAPAQHRPTPTSGAPTPRAVSRPEYGVTQFLLFVP